MAKKPAAEDTVERVQIYRPKYENFAIWVIGDTPLITHAWSEKARREMLGKQQKQIKGGKAERNPDQDFQHSLYEMGVDPQTDQTIYGFPVTAFKKAMLSCAHKDKGIARVSVMQSLFLNADLTRVRPALAGAICDMPLVRIYGDAPAMREDMVRVGSGLNKTANLAYRGQFTNWAVRLHGRYNAEVLSLESIGFLAFEAGIACGVGEWRNEKSGMFGAFHLGGPEEAAAWEKFAAGKGPVPMQVQPPIAAE